MYFVQSVSTFFIFPMWKYILLCSFFCSLSLQSELLDLLSSTDEFLQDFQTENQLLPDSESFIRMLKRNYNLKDNRESRKISKRSSEKETLVRDKEGVYLLSKIENVLKIPVKFPNDINILSSHNLLYVTALEANGTNPQTQLANDLVIFQYSSIQGIREYGRTPVLGGTRISIHSFQNVTYIITAEHEAQNFPDSFQGSTIYKLIVRQGKTYMEKVQILNVIKPNDVKFWEHQDQLYLAVGTNMGSDKLRTGTLIYRWLGHHFDCIQIIASKNVKSVTPFVIESFMYIAIANFQDENGNSDIHSEILQFSLNEMKFKPFQRIRTHGANDFSYFKFYDVESGKSEHFLVVANFGGKDSKRVPDSVVYKFTHEYFVPFQSFIVPGITEWLPIQGPNREFILLASYSDGVIGFQYDGWRFSEVSLHFGQAPFGGSIQSMRTFQYFGDTFLTIADKENDGNNINLWKLSFTKKNDLEKKYEELETWCTEMNAKFEEDNFDQAMEDLVLVAENASEESIEEIQVESLKLRNLDEEIQDELEELNEETQYLKNILKDAERELENEKEDSEIPLVIGSGEIASLEINCTTKNCCKFKNIKILKLNGENVDEFLANAVSLNDDLEESVLEFEHVIFEDDLTSSMVNGHPSETLVDTSSSTFLNAEFIVNGTIFIKGDLNVNGLFDGFPVDKGHLLLNKGLQNVEGKLYVDSLKVKNLKLLGLVNSEPIEKLIKKTDLDLKNNYKELNVNNLFVEGLIKGVNFSQIFNRSFNLENQTLEDDFNAEFLEADEVIVDSNKISGMNINEVLEAYNDYRCQPNADTVDSKNFRSNEEEPKAEFDEQIIIIEGFLRVQDISDDNNQTSLQDVLSNGYKLNESLIDSKFHFSNIIVENLEVQKINAVPVSSWVKRNSEDVQRVQGKKKFMGNIRVRERVSVETLNEVNLEKLDMDTLRLSGDQIISSNLNLDALTCQEIETEGAFFGNQPFNQLGRLELSQSLVTENLQIENLTVFGTIDSFSWDNIIGDSVFEEDTIVWGEKKIQGEMKINNLNLSGRLNDLFLEDFMTLTSTDANKIVLDRNVTLENSLSVNELQFEGQLDSYLDPDFEYDWLLQDKSQIITTAIAFENVEMKSGSNVMNETINNVNLRKLFFKSLKVDEDANIKNLFAMNKVRAEEVEIGGTLNKAHFNESVLRSKADKPQHLSGKWFLNEGLTVNGSFIAEGFMSGLNLSLLCGLDASDKVNLIVGGCLHLEKEPTIKFKINGIELSKKLQEVWMRSENTTLRGQKIKFLDVELLGRTDLSGFLNGANISDISKHYLSKNQSRVISSDYEFEELIVQNSCRMRKATVGGPVNGVNLTHWAKNVLLQDQEQVVEEPLRFDFFQTSDLKLEGKVNGVDLLSEVLRQDMENAVVEGEKTFHGVNVLNLTMEQGKLLQGVDVDSWRENRVRKTQDAVIRGNLVLASAEFGGNFSVNGKVNDIYFDSEHLLLTQGDQVVTGVKRFELKEAVDGPMRIKFFEVMGPVGGLDLDDLIKNQAYADRDLVFTREKTLKGDLMANSLEVDGLFHGVNISETCQSLQEPIDVNASKGKFDELLNETKTLLEVVKGRAFYLDHFELVQTLKPNVKAVVPTLDSEGNHLLAVFTPAMMRFIKWNEYSESFTNTDEGLTIVDNITFVTSENSENNSLLYIETSKSARIFQSQLLKEIEATGTSCVASFYLKSLGKSCVFIGQKWNSSRILCNSILMNDLQTYQWLDSKGSVQVTALTIDGDVFLAVINKEEVFDKIENTLYIYRFDPKYQHFQVTHMLAEVNPVALSSITYKHDHYLVSAGGHLPESVHNSVLSVFKFNKHHKVFVRSQAIRVDTPVDVHFALLPSSQLALYVLTSNPTKPLVVFLHRGISGFLEETSGLSLYPGSSLYSFTDTGNQHFVIISGFGRGQIIRAGFKGSRPVS